MADKGGSGAKSSSTRTSGGAGTRPPARAARTGPKTAEPATAKPAAAKPSTRNKATIPTPAAAKRSARKKTTTAKSRRSTPSRTRGEGQATVTAEQVAEQATKYKRKASTYRNDPKKT